MRHNFCLSCIAVGAINYASIQLKYLLALTQGVPWNHPFDDGTAIAALAERVSLSRPEPVLPSLLGPEASHQTPQHGMNRVYSYTMVQVA